MTLDSSRPSMAKKVGLLRGRNDARLMTNPVRHVFCLFFPSDPDVDSVRYDPKTRNMFSISSTRSVSVASKRPRKNQKPQFLHTPMPMAGSQSRQVATVDTNLSYVDRPALAFRAYTPVIPSPPSLYRVSNFSSVLVLDEGNPLKRFFMRMTSLSFSEF